MYFCLCRKLEQLFVAITVCYERKLVYTTNRHPNACRNLYSGLRNTINSKHGGFFANDYYLYYF